MNANLMTKDQANDLATAVAKRNFERTCAQGFLLACATNNVTVTEALLTPYLKAFNQAALALYNMQWYLFQAGVGRKPGSKPTMRFSAKVRCDTRCTHATGDDCTCSCGGINHGTFFAGQFAGSSDAAGAVKAVREQNAAALKALNDDPAARLLHLFGVGQHRERMEVRAS